MKSPHDFQKIISKSISSLFKINFNAINLFIPYMIYQRFKELSLIANDTYLHCRCINSIQYVSIFRVSVARNFTMDAGAYATPSQKCLSMNP